MGVRGKRDGLVRSRRGRGRGIGRDPIDACIVVTLIALIILGALYGSFRSRDPERRVVGTVGIVGLAASDGTTIQTRVGFVQTRRRTPAPLLPAPVADVWTLELFPIAVRTKRGWEDHSATMTPLAVDVLDAEDMLVAGVAERIVFEANLRRSDLPLPDAAPEPSVYAAGPMTRIDVRGIVANLVACAIIAGVVATWFFGVRGHKRGRRYVSGACRRCGYDLAGLDVCPECGESRRESAT